MSFTAEEYIKCEINTNAALQHSACASESRLSLFAPQAVTLEEYSKDVVVITSR